MFSSLSRSLLTVHTTSYVEYLAMYVRINGINLIALDSRTMGGDVCLFKETKLFWEFLGRPSCSMLFGRSLTHSLSALNSKPIHFSLTSASDFCMFSFRKLSMTLTLFTRWNAKTWRCEWNKIERKSYTNGRRLFRFPKNEETGLIFSTWHSIKTRFPIWLLEWSTLMLTHFMAL